MTTTSASLKAFSVRIEGIVQGVGFRPFVYRLARELSLRGWVVNRNDGVLIHAEGEKAVPGIFTDRLRKQAPPAANISRIETQTAEPGNYGQFTIKGSRSVPGSITGVSPDISICQDCIDDMKKQPHRKDYPLVNCTNCGPRFSIINRLPYDRVNTTMAKFAMCTVCEQEYNDPGNRRFHAQPVSCNNCGPLYTTVTSGVNSGKKGTVKILSDDKDMDDPLHFRSRLDIERLCTILEGGGLAAVKGTGGYHLLCDAMNYEAVEKLRDLKGRDRKPFAVMFRDTETVKKHCLANEAELDLLQSWRRPVVIISRRPASDEINGKTGCTAEKNSQCNGRSALSDDHWNVFPVDGTGLPAGSDDMILYPEGKQISGNVSGGVGSVGAILPYMPFHYLLFEKLKLSALVFTSGNISGSPVLADDTEAHATFNGKTDAFVTYNRDIINPVDDSVCRFSGKGFQIIRRARGYVPEMINIPFRAEGIFAAGSDLKNAFAIGKGNYAIPGQHTGDLENYDTFCRYRHNIERFSSLFSFTAGTVACDLHPGFYSARFAAGMARETGSRLIRVQHHHAHIASCMAEKGLDGPVIGVCFDGTGYGDDGKIWGSEFMICDYDGYQRHSHLSYISLPGGDTAIREPWRTALACLRDSGHGDADHWVDNALHGIPGEEIETVEKMIAGGINSPLSCGAGRLFDVVAALTGICLKAGYDGEAPMLLESICSPGIDEGYEFANGSFALVEQVMADIKKGTATDRIASRFHNGMADNIHRTVMLIYRETGIERVVLSGGVFQNSYLMNRVLHLLGRERLKIFTNAIVPVNDGGVALGQLAIAAKKQNNHVFKHSGKNRSN